MKSAILNQALPKIAENTDSGFWLSITHFSLAWISDEERVANPVASTMTELVRQTPSDGIVRGDHVYNIWQTAFPYDQFAGEFYKETEDYQINKLLSTYFQYEYDDCAKYNKLKKNQNYTADWPSNIGPEIGELNGYSSVTPTLTSELTVANMPYPLNEANGVAGITKFSKLFPIKAYNLIGKDDNDGTVTINYSLDLPAISSKIANAINFYANSIGNFKFNRIGLHMSVCTKVEPSSADQVKDVYMPQADKEPVLFAVIDLGGQGQGCSGNDVNFEIYKTRDDRGFSGWNFDAQLAISIANGENIAESYETFYVDAMRDDATRYYQAQMMNNASIAQTVMQLQMMVLQLATSFESLTGVNPYSTIKFAGYNVEAALGVDREYTISKGSSNNRMLLDGLAFRGVSNQAVEYINSSNALFSLKSYSNQNRISDGDLVKITVYNLDGRFYTVAGNDVSRWNGSILFANYDEASDSKTKIFEINTDLIKGMGFAKVTVLFSFSASLQKWVLENLSVIDETNLIG